MPFLGRQRLRDRNGFDKADDRDQECGQQQLLQQLRCERGQGEGRQALRDGADDLHACVFKVQIPDSDRGRDNGCNGSRFGRDIGHGCAHTHRPQHGFEALADPEQKSRRAHTDHDGGPIELRDMRYQRHDQFQQVMPFGLDPEDVAQLTGRNDEAGCRDEARNHRV